MGKMRRGKISGGALRYVSPLHRVPSPCTTKHPEMISGGVSPTTAVPPFQVKQRVYARDHDDAPRRATVMEVGFDSDGVPKYYVHFDHQDSRMDRWLSASDLKPSDVKVSKFQPVVNPTGMVTRNMASRAPQSVVNSATAATAAATAAGAQSAMQNDQGPKKLISPAPGSTSEHILRARRDSSFFSRPKNISNVMIGAYDVDAWYFSPYHIARPKVRYSSDTCAPMFFTDTNGQMDVKMRVGANDGDAGLLRYADAAANGPITGASSSVAALSSSCTVAPFTLHVCPYCVEPFSCHMSVVRHLQYECIRHPPGQEIYRDPDQRIILFELDGKIEPHFGQNLALLSKLFLEHKALDYDMTPFLFYVLCLVTPHGCEILGYFSKEKISPDGFNLSCILTLPQFQGRGIGRFLVEMSYELSRREGKVGSPEKPLSDLGEATYLSYWKDAVMDVITAAADRGSGISIETIVESTFMTQNDVVATLQKLNILSGGGGKQNRKYALSVTSEHVRQHEERKARRLAATTTNYIFDPSMLSWNPHWYSQKVGDSPSPNYTPILAFPTASAGRKHA